MTQSLDDLILDAGEAGASEHNLAQKRQRKIRPKTNGFLVHGNLEYNCYRDQLTARCKMKINISQKFKWNNAVITMIGAVLVLSVTPVSAQSDQDLIEVARSVIKVDRQAAVVAAMELTQAESVDFWPLYREYRFEMDKVNDGLMKLVLEYAKLYPDVPDDRAKEMLKEYTDLQQRQLAKRTTYLKKFSKILPPAKALRFAQVETRLDLIAQLQLAAAVPLVPVGGSQ